jgi:hypothetical protein
VTNFVLKNALHIERFSATISEVVRADGFWTKGRFEI